MRSLLFIILTISTSAFAEVDLFQPLPGSGEIYFEYPFILSNVTSTNSNQNSILFHFRDGHAEFRSVNSTKPANTYPCELEVQYSHADVATMKRTGKFPDLTFKNTNTNTKLTVYKASPQEITFSLNKRSWSSSGLELRYVNGPDSESRALWIHCTGENLRLLELVESFESALFIKNWKP